MSEIAVPEIKKRVGIFVTWARGFRIMKRTQFLVG